MCRVTLCAFLVAAVGVAAAPLPVLNDDRALLYRRMTPQDIYMRTDGDGETGLLEVRSPVDGSDNQNKMPKTVDVLPLHMPRPRHPIRPKEWEEWNGPSPGGEPGPSSTVGRRNPKSVPWGKKKKGGRPGKSSDDPPSSSGNVQPPAESSSFQYLSKLGQRNDFFPSKPREGWKKRKPPRDSHPPNSSITGSRPRRGRIQPEVSLHNDEVRADAPSSAPVSARGRSSRPLSPVLRKSI